MTHFLFEPKTNMKLSKKKRNNNSILIEEMKLLKPEIKTRLASNESRGI